MKVDISSFLTKIVEYGLLAGLVITAIVAPFHVFFAIKTGCIPDSIPYIFSWTPDFCTNDDYFPHVTFWRGFVWRLLFCLLAIVIGVLMLMGLHKKWKSPQTLSDEPTSDEPTVERVLIAIRSIVSKDPEDKLRK